MKRYRIVNGVPVLPPQDAVSAEGRVISNFAGRIESDAVFAAAHGYYPIKEAEFMEHVKSEDLLEEEERLFAASAEYVLQSGMWARTVK